jgi:mRNA interferase MazF
VNNASTGLADTPRWGEVWLVTLDPTIGHEQAGTRPAVIVSANGFNQSGAGLTIVAPMTRVYKGVPWHVQVNPPEGRVRDTCYIKCDDVRSISTERLIKRWGVLSVRTMGEVADHLRVILQL